MRIKELRIEKNQNMRQTAIALGIPYTTYVSYEKGDREPNSEMLIALAEYFNCSVDYLIGRSDDRIDEETLDKVNSIDQDILEKAGNLFEAKRLQELRDNSKDKSYIFRTPINDILTIEEMEHITKYAELDPYGKEAVDSVLNVEYKRCKETPAQTTEQEEEEPTIEIRCAEFRVSAGFGVPLDDSDQWKIISIPDNHETQNADFALEIKGDSMEPVYREGDIVLVKKQDVIDEGEVGIFIIEGEGYIKKYGGNRLISLNAKYDDIMFADCDPDRIKCAGKVIGRV